MDKRTEMIEEIVSILSKVKECDISALDANLFGFKYGYTSGEMLDVCMELRKRYGVNLKSFIRNVNEFTVNNIADFLLKI